MSLSIQGNSGFSQRFLQQTLSNQARANERIAAGKRIVRGADDAAGLAIAKRLEAGVRGAAQAELNFADGQSLVRTAEASLQTSQDTIGRMRELTIQAQNGTLSASDRDVIQQEYDQLAAQLDQTAGSTNFGGRQLLDGSASGSGAVVVTDGEGGDTTIEIGDAGASALGVRGLDVSDPASVAALDSAQDRLSAERAKLGALDNTLGSRQQQLSAERISQSEARSRIEDVDVAQEVANATRNRILTDLSLSGQRISNQDRAKLIELIS